MLNMNSLESLNGIGLLIMLSVNPGDLEEHFPDYFKALKDMQTFMESNGRKKGAFIYADEIFSKFEELKDIQQISMYPNQPLDFSSVTQPAKIILHDITGKHFAAAYIEGNDIYVLDSLPDHTKWLINPEIKVHNIPVPLQDSNDCAINTAVNLKAINSIVEIYKSSKIKDEEIFQLRLIYKDVMTHNFIKFVLSDQKAVPVSKHEFENLEAMLISVVYDISPDSELPAKIIGDLRGGAKLEDCIADLDKTISKILQSYTAILENCEQRCELDSMIEDSELNDYTIEKFKSKKEISDEFDMQSISDEPCEVNQSLQEPKAAILTIDSDIIEDIKMFRSIESKVNPYNRHSSEINIENIADESELVDKILEINSNDRSFAKDILANIEMAIEVNSKYTDRETARKNAIKETKAMLEI